LKDIHLRSVDKEIFTHRTGLRILFSSSRPRDIEHEQLLPQIEAVISNLSAMCTTLVLDLGSGLRPYTHTLLRQCDRILFIVEPTYPTNMIGHALIEELDTRGVGRHKIGLILVSREQTSLQIPWQQISDDLGVELAGIISPSPDQAHQASQSGTPLLVLHPAGLVSDQIHKIALHVSTFLPPVQGRARL